MYNELVRENFMNIPLHLCNKEALLPDRELICAHHYHDEIELLCVVDGVLGCEVGGVTYEGRAGDIFFIDYRVPHKTTVIESPAVQTFLQFRPEKFSNDGISEISKYLARFINVGKDPIVHFHAEDEETSELSRCIDNICREHSEEKIAYELYIKSNILAILGFLSRNGILQDASSVFRESSVERILPALSYIDENYKEQITLSELSSVVGLNPSYFCRLFKRATNSTFIEYLNFVRVCRSEKQLAKSDLSVAEIALSLGFSSVSYFNKVFRHFKNCTPTEYRASKRA